MNRKKKEKIISIVTCIMIFIIFFSYNIFFIKNIVISSRKPPFNEIVCARIYHNYELEVLEFFNID